MTQSQSGWRKSGWLGLLALIGAVWVCGRCGAAQTVGPPATVTPRPTTPAGAATAAPQVSVLATRPGAPAGFGLPTVETGASQAGPPGTVSASVLNVRQGPGPSYAAVGQLRKGESVTLLDESGDWLQVRAAAGLTGWVAAQYVVFGSATPEAPAVAPTGAPGALPTAEQEARVAWVTDGDTIRVVLGGQEYPVRYIGMDAPEMGSPEGEAAKQQNAALVRGQTVRLVKDVSETDRYGRLLRYVWVGDVLVNAELVRLGYAQAATYPPDVKYQARFVALQQEAKAAGRGLWAPAAAATRPGNLRAGPGTNYAVVGQVQAGDPLNIVARNGQGDWYQLASGAWIVGYLVANPPRNLSVAATIPTPAPLKPPAVRAPPAAPAAPARQCDPCYPGVCIPQVTFDLDCKDVPYCRFQVVCDPHGFDGDHDGVGCETCR